MDDQRELLKESLRSLFEQSLDDRVDRYLSVNHQRIVGNHHFAHASAESLDLFRDGYFLSCCMVTQAVGEGIAKFVAERNGITAKEKETKEQLVERIQQSGIVSPAFLAAFQQLQRSFRNDLHHMNPAVANIDLKSFAMRNISHLATMECEIFECQFGPQGTLVPAKPLYWDIASDGTVPVYLRLL